MQPSIFRLQLSTLFLSAAVITSACSGSTATDSSRSTSREKASDTAGSIVISGSSTVEPISVAVAEQFSDANPDVEVAVDGPGTGDGFQLFCEGSTDISDASRPIKDEEAGACADNDIEFLELKVGIDGLSVITNGDNTTNRCLTFADLYALVGPESTGFKKWSDADSLASELGSDTKLPGTPLDVYGPGEESGTYDSFVEIVIESFNEDRGQDAVTRPDYAASAQDSVIIQGIQGSESSLGWVGYAFAAGAEGVKALEISDGDGGCVAPTQESIANGTYPIARDLFIYVNAQKLSSNPALARFVEFYLSDEGIKSVAEVGYVQLDEDAIEATRGTFENRTTGSTTKK